MSPRKLLAIILILFLGLISVMAYVARLLIVNDAEIEFREQKRYESYKLAEELRQSSDDLTRMARTYVVTEDPVFEKYYHDILDIRDGNKPRPFKYERVYWDFMVATHEKPRLDGPPFALLKMMREMEFSEKEFEKLREAKDNSDGLVELEEQAMYAVKGIFPDENGEFTLKSKPDREMAIESMYGLAYHREKARIMEPIDQFMELLDHRTSTEIWRLRTQDKVYQRVLIWLGVLGGIFFVLSLCLMNPEVRKPAKKEAAESQEKDLRVRVLAYSIIGMALVAFAVGSVSIFFLYQTALDQQKKTLFQLVTSQARLIEAVARFDKAHSDDVYVGGSDVATYRQIVDAHETFPGIGKTGEFVLGRKSDNKIIPMLDPRHEASKKVEEFSFSKGKFSEPMRRALSGETGTMTGYDYRGVRVVAAYEPIEELNLGIVAKIDTAEVWAPFRGVVTLAVVAAVIFIFFGGVALVKVNNPLIHRLAEGGCRRGAPEECPAEQIEKHELEKIMKQRKD